MLHEAMAADDLAFLATLGGEPQEPADVKLKPEAAGRRFEKPAFHFAHVAELLADHAPPVWLIEDIIEAGTLVQVFGASGCGKSFLVIDWSACIAAGGDACGPINYQERLPAAARPEYLHKRAGLDYVLDQPHGRRMVSK